MLYACAKHNCRLFTVFFFSAYFIVRRYVYVCVCAFFFFSTNALCFLSVMFHAGFFFLNTVFFPLLGFGRYNWKSHLEEKEEEKKKEWSSVFVI